MPIAVIATVAPAHVTTKCPPHEERIFNALLTSADQNIGRIRAFSVVSVNKDTDQEGFYSYEEAACILCVLPRGGIDDERLRLLARAVDGTDSRRLT